MNNKYHVYYYPFGTNVLRRSSFVYEHNERNRECLPRPDCVTRSTIHCGHGPVGPSYFWLAAPYQSSSGLNMTGSHASILMLLRPSIHCSKQSLLVYMPAPPPGSYYRRGM